MSKQVDLPFKVGDLAEARSFQNGFRGAWFRCKITDTSVRKGKAGHVLEYYDYPDEKMKWTKLYQLSAYAGRTRERSRELMLRPRYPPIYRKNQVPPLAEISEVFVIVDDNWKVGDLIDWWTTDCYWSGVITKLLGDDKAMMELKQPPYGEGLTYEIYLKDIRPSLDWSPEHGWTVPIQGSVDGRICAWLIKPKDQGQEADPFQVTDLPESSERHQQLQGNKVLEKVKHAEESVSDMNHIDSGKRNVSGTDAVSESNSGQPKAEAAREDFHSDHPQELGNGRGLSLNSSRAETMEAALMDLEELVNKVRWIKNILKHGVPYSCPGKSQWEFVDHPAASSAPK